MGCTSTSIRDYNDYKTIDGRTSFTADRDNAHGSDSRKMMAQTMQMCMDNGLEIGGEFDEWFKVISCSSDYYDGEQRFGYDAFGANKNDKEGNIMGVDEFRSLCLVTSDLNDMLSDGRMSVDEYEAYMNRLFQEDTMDALLKGDAFEDTADNPNPYMELLREVSNMHGDDPEHAATRQPNSEVAKANAQIMQVSERNVISNACDYATMRDAEEYESTGNYSGVGDPAYFKDHFNSVDNIISQWEEQGLLPEGMTAQDAVARVVDVQKQIENTAQASYEGVAALSFAFKDINAIENKDVKADFVASIFDKNIISDIAMPSSNDVISPGVELLQDLDLARKQPEYYADAYHSYDGPNVLPEAMANTAANLAVEAAGIGVEQAAYTAEMLTADGYKSQTETASYKFEPVANEEEKELNEEVANHESNDVQVDLSTRADEMSILVRQTPSERMLILRDEAIEYYNNGSQQDVTEMFSNRDYTDDEIKYIKDLAAFGTTLADKSPEEIYGCIHKEKDLGKASESLKNADAEHQQAQFEMATLIMACEGSGSDFITQCEDKLGIDPDRAALYYNRAAEIYSESKNSDRQYQGNVSQMSANNVKFMSYTSENGTYDLLKAADASADTYAAAEDEDSKAIKNKAEAELEKLRDNESSLDLDEYSAENTGDEATDEQDRDASDSMTV